jgi:DNA-binding NtrC family response regulator
LPLADATQQFQSDYIMQHVQRARGNMTAAAENLGMSRVRRDTQLALF